MPQTLPDRRDVRDFNNEMDEEISYTRPLALPLDWWRLYKTDQAIQTLDQGLSKGEMIPTILASFAAGDAQPTEDCKVPERCLRAASILRITDGDDPDKSKHDGDVWDSEERRWNWRKGWAEGRWAKQALDTFLMGYGSGVKGGTPKIIQIHTVCPLEERPSFDVQLTFLFFLLEGRSMHAIPPIDIVQRDGSPVPPSKRGPLAWNMRDIQGLSSHLQDHGEDIHGKTSIFYQERTGMMATILPLGVEKSISAFKQSDIAASVDAKGHLEGSGIILTEDDEAIKNKKNVDDRTYSVMFNEKSGLSMGYLTFRHMTQPIEMLEQWVISYDGKIYTDRCPRCQEDTKKNKSSCAA